MTTRILIDVDGVLADLVGALCERLDGVGYKYTPESFNKYEFERVLPTLAAEFVRECMAEEGFCASLPWYPNAQAFVECLKEFSDVVAVTKPYPKGPTWAYERANWLHPHITRVIQTDVKECVEGDVLIEDYEVNALKWLDAHPDGQALLINRPWNRAFETVHQRLRRVHGFGEAICLATHPMVRR